jgi:cephalosporin hydroxylase
MPSLQGWLYRAYAASVAPLVRETFAMDLIVKTRNFQSVRWLGHPIVQNVLDLWVIQETITELKPALIIETGTHQGGSALFYAHLFDLMECQSHVVTVDVKKLTSIEHSRITFLLGSSVSREVIARIEDHASAAQGPVMVILDSLHTAAHVAAELDAYSRFVTPGSFLLVQDGSVDTLPIFRDERPGPVPAIQTFLKQHPEFEIDRARTSKFLISHHPIGWLRRIA